MPLDPIIARGIPADDLTKPLILAEEIRNRRQYNSLLELDRQFRERSYQDQQQQLQQQKTAEAEKQQAIAVYHAARSGNPMARNFALKKLSEQNPGIFQGMDPETAWGQIEPIMRSTLGIESEKPGQLYQTAEGFLPADQAQGKMPYQAPQRPPQYGPDTYTESTVVEDGVPVVYRISTRDPSKRVKIGRGVAPKQGSDKPIPTGALKIVDEAQQAIAAASDSERLVSGAIALLEPDPATKQPKVKLGAVKNLESRGRNFAGVSDANSRAYADIRQTLEKLRNNYLLLAKGVQTEGDAQRAWNSEIGENVQNDNALALQQLKKAQGMIQRALEAQNARIGTVYENYDREPPNAKPAQASKVRRYNPETGRLE